MQNKTIISSTPVPVLRYLNPLEMARNLYTHRNLIRQLAWRDVLGRYKGSYLGILWSFITPLAMLVVYAFVFSVVFKAKWGTGSNESRLEFALTLFCSLLVFNVFAECVSRSPGLILSNANYVKKVVFPLEILPVSALWASLTHAAISLVILLPALIVATRTLSSTIWLFPVIMIPFCALTLGLGWFFAALGVFLRDIAHPIGVAIQILLFTSGVFFPLSVVPEQFQFLLKLNPLVILLEDARRTVMWGQFPDWPWLIFVTCVSIFVMQLGYAWFMKSKRAFADVI
jgi:lipopolysaccharide transport system permease protein